MTCMVLRFLTLLGVMLALALPAQAQVSAADQTAIRDVIEGQVEAFRRDDGDAAFGYASPNIQGMFGTAETFMDMVRQGYRPVYRPRVFDFREIVTLHGDGDAEGPCDRPRRPAGHRLLSDDAAARRQLAHRRLLPAGAGRTPGLIAPPLMSRVSPKVLALLGALTLVWGTNWPLFRIALDELPVWTFRTIVLSAGRDDADGDPADPPRELRRSQGQMAGPDRSPRP